MDLLGLEIHIPVEAEVKNIPVWSLPNSVIRRMGLPPPASEGSKAPTDPPEGILICPTVIRKKGQNSASHAGNGVKEKMSTLLYREFRAAQSPLQMSFVSSNCTAYKLLQDIIPGKKVSHASHAPLLPRGSALKTHQDAIVIYHGRIYLIVKNPKRSRSRQATREPQSVAQSSLHSTSALSSESQEKTSLEAADKALQKKRLRVTVPRIPLKQDLLTKTDKHCTTEMLHTHQEPLNDNKPNNKDAGRKLPAHFHTQGDQEEVANHDGEEEGETQDPDRQEAETQDLNRQEAETQDLNRQEAESTDANNVMDANMQVDYLNGSHSWTRRDPQNAASACTSSQQTCDFRELEQKEKIARLKAKLRQKEVDLHNKHSTK